MKKIIISLIIASMLSISYAFSSDNNDTEYKYGIEFNIVWPFVPGVEIYTGKLTTQLWKSESMRGEILTGFTIRPGTSNDENAESMSEYGLGLGYRQYLYGNFHVEFMVFPFYAFEENNLIDGKDYSGLAITTELYTGFKFYIFDFDKSTLYLMPQVGVGINPYSDLGPVTEESSFFPVISIQVGVSF